jgi:hypothetical protein
MNAENLKIRASAAGLLMSGGAGITAKQIEMLAELQARKDGQGKPLTPKMESDLSDLIAKRNAPPELGATGKSYIKSLWLCLEYGYKEPMVTDVLLKGNMCEQDGMALVTDVYGGDEFRAKNKKNFEDDFFMGTPDVILSKIIEDIKNAWSLKTFAEIEKPDPVYYAQGQVYMHLTGRRLFRIHHCLINTPAELVYNEQKKFFWKYGGDENNQHFKEAAEQIARNHNFDHIPMEQRVKTFEFEYNADFIAELQSKVILARKYYSTLQL